MAIYGLSALLIREFAIRYRTGPAGVLLLGLAFGVLNEGMAAHSLFNPAWPGVAVQGSYGRLGGVNWLWAEWIVPFHAVYSISFPIFLSRQFWPEVRDTRFLSDRWAVLLVPVPFVVAIVTSFLVGAYPLSLVDWLGMFGFVALMVLLAERWGESFSAFAASSRWVPSAAAAATVGVLFFVVGQVGTWQTPDLGPYPVVGIVRLLAFYLGVAAFALCLAPSAAGEKARFAFVLGGIGFYVALSPFSEFLLGRSALVPIDVVVFVALAWLYRRRTALVTPPSAPAGARAAPGS
ncbi:MAG: hypothetical protein ABSB97_04680 [Thermoplasmata archaeon]|jgi:hypothetical protein